MIQKNETRGSMETWIIHPNHHQWASWQYLDGVFEKTGCPGIFEYWSWGWTVFNFVCTGCKGRSSLVERPGCCGSRWGLSRKRCVNPFAERLRHTLWSSRGPGGGATLWSRAAPGLWVWGRFPYSWGDPEAQRKTLFCASTTEVCQFAQCWPQRAETAVPATKTSQHDVTTEQTKPWAHSEKKNWHRAMRGR